MKLIEARRRARGAGGTCLPHVALPLVVPHAALQIPQHRGEEYDAGGDEEKAQEERTERADLPMCFATWLRNAALCLSKSTLTTEVQTSTRCLARLAKMRATLPIRNDINKNQQPGSIDLNPRPNYSE